MDKNSFCFVVLAYNHQQYILEHLDSIKYQVVNFGFNVDVQLVINDDASKDDTQRLVQEWVEQNNSLFYRVDFVFNDTNLGTCQSVCNCLRLLDSDYCKLTAGDDVYSNENIFELIEYSKEADIVTAIPVRLVDDTLDLSKSEMAFTLGLDVYRNLSKIVRNVNFINAPNALYASRYLNNPKLINFLADYDVVEDWPIQIFISDCDPAARVKVVDKCYVYYRRTAGSTYIIASDRLCCDMYHIYDYLLSNTRGVFGRFILRNRRFCFGLKSRWLKKMLNISVFYYLLMIVFNRDVLNKVINHFLSSGKIRSYQEHYNNIVNISKQHVVEINDK